MNSGRVLPILMLLCLVLGGLPIINAIIIDPTIVFTEDNITYGVTVPIDFNNITFDAHWMNFNGLGFNITCTNPVFINFSLFGNPYSVTAGMKIFKFTTSTPNRNCTFNITGLKTSHAYVVYNGSTLKSITSSNPLGYIQWKHNLTSSHTFILYDTNAGSPPTISSPSIANGSTNVPINTASLRAYISDPDGDTIGWYIATFPNVGSSWSMGGDTNGTKTCNILGLHYSTTYFWYVGAIDVYGSISWYNTTLHFTTSAPGPSSGGSMTDLVVKYVIPIMIALMLLMFLVIMLYTGTVTPELIFIWLLAAIAAIVLIVILL